MRKLLYIDSSYTLTQIRERGLDNVAHIRFLDGYFDRVWSAHPVDTHPAADPDIPITGAPVFEHLSEKHVYVRGRYGRYAALAQMSAPINAVLGLWSFVLALIKLVRREKIAVIRTGDPLFCGLIGLIVTRCTGARLVVRINGDHSMIRANTGTAIMPSFFRSRKVEERIERLVLSRADRIILYTSAHIEFVLRNGANKENICIVRHGRLIQTCHMADPSTRPEPVDQDLNRLLGTRQWMVHIGRLHQVKHAEDCYDALLQLSSQGSKVGLLLIGDGPLRGTIAARAHADGLTERVWFMGNIDQESIARILPRCMLALSPLTGRALAEVAFAALPIVAYDLDWQGEVVETDVTGILVPAGDTAAMARGVERLLGDAALRRKLGFEVRRRALDLLDPQEQTRLEIEAYSSLEVLS